MYEDEIPVGRAEDLTGKRFDSCIVLYRVKSPIKTARWKCKCDCGNIFYAYANNLKSNYNHNCGCQSQRGINLLNGDSYNGKNKLDLAGKIYGRLTVLKDSGKRTKQGNGGSVIWICQCSCGNIVEVASGDLRSFHTMSCGCLRSKGEEKINHILSSNKILYVTQKSFTSLNSKKNYPLKFDFYIDNKYLIEYDGDIHSDTPHSRGWFSDDYRQDIKERDNLKNQWCKDNNIPLIRIPYTHLNELCLEDLLLETTQFRVV